MSLSDVHVYIGDGKDSVRHLSSWKRDATYFSYSKIGDAQWTTNASVTYIAKMWAFDKIVSFVDIEKFYNDTKRTFYPMRKFFFVSEFFL